MQAETSPVFEFECALTEERAPGGFKVVRVPPEYLFTFFCSKDPLFPAAALSQRYQARNEGEGGWEGRRETLTRSSSYSGSFGSKRRGNIIASLRK